MKTSLLRYVLLAGLIAVSSSSVASAQGGFFDWINKLSGPQVSAFVPYYEYCVGQPLRFRYQIDAEGSCETLKEHRDGERGGKAPAFATARGWALRVGYGPKELSSTSDEPAGISTDIDVESLQPSLLYMHPFGPRYSVAGEIGVLRYRFSGRGFDGFHRYAITVAPQFFVRTTNNSRLFVSLRLRYFTEKMLSQDFGGPPEAERGGGESDVGFTVGYDF